MTTASEGFFSPYLYLGIPEGCCDLKIIKKAYHDKSKRIHPDRKLGSSSAEFAILQKCYTWLKAIAIETQGKGFEYNQSLEDKVRSMQERSSNGLKTHKNFAQNQYESQYSSQNQYEAQHPLQYQYPSRQSHQRPEVPLDTTRDPTAKGKADFKSKIQDNSMIGYEDFDPDVVYKQMMEGRERQSLNYQDVRKDVQSVSDLYNGTLEPTIEGFSGFDGDYGNGAQLVSDGNFMFVHGNATAGQPGWTGGFSQVEGFNLETPAISDNLISNHDLQSYNRTRMGNISNPDKLTAKQFKEHMRNLDSVYENSLKAQTENNRPAISNYLGKLSETTRNNLFDQLKLT